MYRLITLALLITITVSVIADEKPNNNLIIFLVQSNRDELTLKNDALTIAGAVQKAKPGDLLRATTIAGDEIFTLALDPKKTNPLQVQQTQNQAIAQLRTSFMNLFENPPETDENDIASGLIRAIDFVNAAPTHKRVTLVLFSGGLHNVGVADFRGSYPDYSWIAHRLSDFSAVPENTTTAKFDAIIVPERGEYINHYHSRKIRKWYAVLFHFRRIQLIGFTDSHTTASLRLERGGTPIYKVPENINLNGDLTLTAIGKLSAEEEAETDTQ